MGVAHAFRVCISLLGQPQQSTSGFLFCHSKNTFGFLWELSLWLSDGCPLAPSLPGFSLHTHILMSLCAQISFSWRDASHIEWGPICTTSFSLCYHFTDSVSKPSQILRYRKLEHQCLIWGRYKPSHDRAVTKNPLPNPIRWILLSTDIYWLLSLWEIMCRILDTQKGSCPHEAYLSVKGNRK